VGQINYAKEKFFFLCLKENQLVSLRIYFFFGFRFTFSLVSNSVSLLVHFLLASVLILFEFIVSSYQVHFLFGFWFTFSLVSSSVSPWVHFLLASVQFLFGLRFSFSSSLLSLRTRSIFSLVSGSLSLWSPIQFLLGFFNLCTNLIQRKNRSNPKRN
jgi:hypothetical protein